MNKLSFTVLSFMILVSACQTEVKPPQAVLPVPSERQLAWHELEQYAFLIIY